MAIKLIAFDLDGTLLNSKKEITPRTRTAIQQAQAKGVRVTISTGRMICSAEQFGKQIKANAPLICCNGGVVQEIGAEKSLFARYLPEETVRKMLTVCYEKHWYVNWYIGNDIYVPKLDWDYFYAYGTTKENMRFVEAGDNYLQYTKNVPQCVLRDLTGHAYDKSKELLQIVGGGFQLQQNTGKTIDLSPIDVNKATGLSWLAEQYGITPDEVMACGDGDNDLAMLRYAGTAVVPENGKTEAKALATYHADSNDNDGIAKAIEELVLK